MEIRHADLQIEVEDAEDGGVLLTIIDSARLSLSLPRRTARELLDAIDACMKTGERQTTDSVDVWRTADDLPLFGMHVGIDGASWTCGAVRSWDVDGLADELEALLLDMLKAHAAELRAWASDAGVRLPSAESAGELREQVRDLPQEPQIQEQPGYGYQPGFQQPQQWQQQPWN